MTDTPSAPGFTAWAHLEAMGHRGHWGSVTEQVIAGAAFLRIDEFCIGEETASATHYYSPSSIYCLTPCTEDRARLMATPYHLRPRAAIEAGEDDLHDVDLVEDDDNRCCRVCGCTEFDACADGCSWVRDPQEIGDLCSACLPAVEHAIKVTAGEVNAAAMSEPF